MDQELDHHVHMHCIVSGGGLKKDGAIRKSSKNFFIRTEVLRDKFKGKYMAPLSFSSSCECLRNSYHWKKWMDSLYEKDWCPYIKETFNGFGNAIAYPGQYTHKITISNSRILSATEDTVTFSARGKKPGKPKRQVALTHTESIRRYLMHVLPSGLQKIRYYGFLNNRMKHKNLKVIFKLQNGRQFKQRYAGMAMAELLKTVWNFDICLCPECGHPAMKQIRRCYARPS